MTEKVLLGLSGGVDSAVAAYLLKKQGYDVTACFMRNWDSALNNDILGNPTLNEEICPQESDYNDALKVAKQLDIPLLRVDYIQEYWDNVFQTFIREYQKGRTPNPDILCNKYIKFDAFYRFALEKGFDKLATGHYCKRVEKDNEVYLGKALDTNKDQTYFLSQVNYPALAMALFPLGDITKDEVRNIARKLHLAVAAKKDSTGICFIGERNFREFLKNYLPMKEGKIIDIERREIIGKHQGVYYYTIGQRKGFAIGGNRGPYFCVGKDVSKNELYLASSQDEDWLNADQCTCTDLNFFHPLKSRELKCQAKFRYRQQVHPVTLIINDDHTATVTFPQTIQAVTEGQQAVFYDGDICLGGGTIDVVYYHGISRMERIHNYLNG